MSRNSGSERYRIDRMGRSRSRSIDDNHYFNVEKRKRSRYMGDNEFIDVFEYKQSPDERKRLRKRRQMPQGYTSRFVKLKNLRGRRY